MSIFTKAVVWSQPLGVGAWQIFEDGSHAYTLNQELIKLLSCLGGKMTEKVCFCRVVRKKN